MWRDDAYILDMLLAARKIQRYCRDVTWDEFERQEVLQDAILRLIQIIGEAAWKLSAEYREIHPDIPWQEIIGMRHRLVHEYFHIDLERVWDVVQKDIPGLISLLEPLVPQDI
jgi:uncharacterized protein with HEPN domain